MTPGVATGQACSNCRHGDESKFACAWEQRKLGDVFAYEQPGPYIVKSTEYDDSFSTPVLTAGKTFVLGYIDEPFGVKLASSDDPVVLFDDFTTSARYVDFPFKVKSSAVKLLTLRDRTDDIAVAFSALLRIGYEPAGHERHWISKFAGFNVRFPASSDEQRAIGALFRDVDDLIALHQRKPILSHIVLAEPGKRSHNKVDILILEFLNNM